MLNQAIYTHIRAGNLYDALEICHLVDQPWRSALLRGALPFTWRDISMYGLYPCFLNTSLTGCYIPASRDPNDDIEEDADENTGEEVAAKPRWEGNRRRRLWRETCSRGANNVCMPYTQII